MNGYKLLADSYKQILDKTDDEQKKANIEKSIKALETMADKTDDEIMEIFNTGAFNDILRAYCKKALINCNINRETTTAVMSELDWLLDTANCKDLMR